MGPTICVHPIGLQFCQKHGSHHPVHTSSIFSGAGGGITRPYKYIFRGVPLQMDFQGRVTPSPAPTNDFFNFEIFLNENI